MQKQIKCLVQKNGSILVETEDRELAQYLSQKTLESKGDGANIEWGDQWRSMWKNQRSPEEWGDQKA